jgi:hypothetical protein
MSEASMLALVQSALGTAGISDVLIAVGEFEPCGRVGATFAGGLVGNEVGDALGGVGDANGSLPPQMLVAVSQSAVYGFAAPSRRREPTDLAFQLARDTLRVKVHKRVNGRVLELIDSATGARIELEGSRAPSTHSKDVISLLQ